MGIIRSVRKIYTKNKDLMAFVRLEDEHDHIELIVFPKVYDAQPRLWEEDQIIIIEGKIDRKEDECKIIVNKAMEFDESYFTLGFDFSDSQDSVPGSNHIKQLVLQVDQHKSNTQVLRDLQQVFDKYPGQDNVTLILLADTTNKKKLQPAIAVNASSTELIIALERILKPGTIQII